MKTHTRLLRFRLLVMLFVVLLSASAFASATHYVFWDAYPLRCQSKARGSVAIYRDYNAPVWAYYGYCIQYSPNINIRTPILGHKWNVSFPYRPQPPPELPYMWVYYEWVNGSGGQLEAREFYAYSNSSVYIGQNRYRLHPTMPNTLCFEFDNIQYAGFVGSVAEIAYIPNILDFPRNAEEVWASAWLCDTANCTNLTSLGNATYSMYNYFYDFSSCRGYLNQLINFPFEGTHQGLPVYGGCYFENCDLEIYPNNDYLMTDMPTELVIINSTITFTNPTPYRTQEWSFMPNFEGIDDPESPDRRNRIYFKDVTLVSPFPVPTYLDIRAIYSNITIDNLKFVPNDLGDFTFAPNTDITISFADVLTSSNPLVYLRVGDDNHLPVWGRQSNVKILNSRNASYLTIWLYDTMPPTGTSANLLINNSALLMLDIYEDGGSWEITNSRIAFVRFFSNRTAGFFPLICEKRVTPLELYFYYGGSFFSYHKLPANCNLESPITIGDMATLDANWNTLSCSDKAIFGLDTITDNVHWCASKPHRLIDGILKNAIIDNMPRLGLATFGYSTHYLLENVHFTQNVSYMTPLLYPNWSWWHWMFPYSFMDIYGGSLSATNVTLYDTYRVMSWANATGITILGCTGRPGSICDLLPPPPTTTTTTTTIPPPPPTTTTTTTTISPQTTTTIPRTTTTIPSSPTSYEPTYTQGDLMLITGDVIGRGLITTKEMIPILITGVVGLGVMITLGFKLLKQE